MISTRFANGPSPSTAALIRLAAFLASLATVIVVPWTFAAAALGRESAPAAFATAGLTVAVTLIMVFVARRLDPLRR